VEFLRWFYERFADLAAPMTQADVVAWFDPEVHLDMTRRVFNPGSYDGYEGLLAALAELRETWERFVLQPEAFLDAGDNVAVVEAVAGRSRGSGVNVLNRSTSVYTLRNGRVVHLVVYENPHEGLEAAGLSE
jgi:ketosteroid isomerase-like protein